MQQREKTGGRVAGTPNKVTATVKDNIIAVFNRLDGTAGMAKWAEENPTQFYQIYAKLLPTDINNNITGDLLISEIVRRVV
jgi:hypothetical protein